MAMNAQAGFSLQDSLVVLVALAVGATLTQPYWTQGIARYDASRASDDIVEILAEARHLAIGRAQAVPVVVDERNRSVSVEGGSWRKLPTGVALAGPKPDRDGRAVLVFNPDGSSDGGQLVVASRSSAVSLLLDAQSGGVRRFEAGER